MDIHSMDMTVQMRQSLYWYISSWGRRSLRARLGKRRRPPQLL